MATTHRPVERECNLTTVGNRLVIAGHFDITQFRRALLQLRELVEVRSYKDIRLDFSDCTFTHAPPVLALATATQQYQTQNIGFELILPEDEKVERLFKNSNWANIIDPTNFDPSDFQSSVHMPALRYKIRTNNTTLSMTCWSRCLPA
jgi:hypothetical protein